MNRSLSSPRGMHHKRSSKFKKMLGNDFDERTLEDPFHNFRIQTLKNGYSIPEAFQDNSAASVNPVPLLAAYRELPDINAQIEPIFNFPSPIQQYSLGEGPSSIRESRSSSLAQNIAGSLKIAQRKATSTNLFKRIGGSMRSTSDKTSPSPILSPYKDAQIHDDTKESINSRDEILNKDEGLNELKSADVTPKRTSGYGPQARIKYDLYLKFENIACSVNYDLTFYSALFDRNKNEFIT